MTAWPFQSTGSTKEDTARQTTFYLTNTTTNNEMTYLPTEIDLFKNDLFTHIVKIIGSFLGLLVIVLTILFIYYIYLKCFQKTTNEGEINEDQGEQIINL